MLIWQCERYCADIFSIYNKYISNDRIKARRMQATQTTKLIFRNLQNERTSLTTKWNNFDFLKIWLNSIYGFRSRNFWHFDSFLSTSIGCIHVCIYMLVCVNANFMHKRLVELSNCFPEINEMENWKQWNAYAKCLSVYIVYAKSHTCDVVKITTENHWIEE